MTDNKPDRQLINDIKEGDRSAFEKLVNRHKNYAFTIAVRILNDQHLAEEVAHDAFMTVLKSAHSFKQDSKFTTWFYRIVANKAIGKTRKKTISATPIDETVLNLNDGIQADQNLVEHSRDHYLKLGISKLNPQERKLITLYYLKEFDQSEIEKMTGLNKNHLKVSIFRAKNKLKEILKQLLPEEFENLI